MILIATQCFPPDKGGIEVLMGGLADALAASGREVAIYADRAHGGGEIRAPYPIRRFGGLKPLRRRLKAWAMARAAKGAKVGGVFADSWKSVELLPNLDAPIAVLAHGMEFPARPSAAKSARITRAFAKVRTVIASSRYTAALAQPYLGPKTRLVVINPPSGPTVAPSPATFEAVRALVDGRAPVLLTLARLEARKGVDMVIHAMPDVLKAHSRAIYIVAGGGDDRVRLEELAREVAVADRVRFVGPVDGGMKTALFMAADAFVMPARREGDSVEGFGIAYREAAAHGVPSLAGREGGAVDAVSDEETGLLCNPTDQADVTRQILRLLNDKERLGGNATLQARLSGGWPTAVKAYLDALR
jgi:phosphatidylinositol alpha-1,6-mannosyltransferase